MLKKAGLLCFIALISLSVSQYTNASSAKTGKSLAVYTANGVQPPTYKKEVNVKAIKMEVKNNVLATKVDRKNTKLTKSNKFIGLNLSDIKDDKHRTLVEKILHKAHKYEGVPYKFGGTTPKGFDCSGYLGYVYKEAIGLVLPRSADDQYEFGKKIEKNKLLPGDMVFFETYEKGISHSGIYIGDNKFISATTSKGVAVADMSSGYWFDRYIGAKRIL